MYFLVHRLDCKDRLQWFLIIYHKNLKLNVSADASDTMFLAYP